MAVTDERVSRRRLLKRAGAGAAAVGAGSMITAATASAAFDPGFSTACAPQGCGECANQQACGTGCFCITTSSGCCFCHESSSCAELVACSTDADCHPGWACAYSCCGGTLCLPHCGSVILGVTLNATPNATGPTSSGGVASGGHHPEPEAPPHRGHGHQ
jgi:hypothetical protein